MVAGRQDDRFFQHRRWQERKGAESGKRRAKRQSSRARQRCASDFQGGLSRKRRRLLESKSAHAHLDYQRSRISRRASESEADYKRELRRTELQLDARWIAHLLRGESSRGTLL